MNPTPRRAAKLLVLLACAVLTACGGSGTSVNNNTSDTSVYYSQSLAFRNATSAVLYAWGYNGYGQLGDNTTTNRTAPVRVLVGNERYSGVAIGSNHVLAFMNNSTVRTWGYNSFGQLGVRPADKATSNLPLKVAGLNGTRSVAAGHNFSLALANYSSTTRVLGWGRNDRGQLGNNAVIDSLSPVAVQLAPATGGHLPATVSQIAVGSDHCLALDTTTNIVWAWGSNTFGQLGDPNLAATSRAYAAPVAGITGTVTAVAAGGSTSYALTSDGRVWAWGYNGFGQLGQDPAVFASKAAPSPLSLTQVTAIAAGLTHAVVLRTVSNEVWSWGGNIYGQMGINRLADQQARTNLYFPLPQQALASATPGDVLTGVKELVAVTGNHTVVRMGDNTLRAWGSNLFGQLGNPVVDISPLPVAVTGIP